MIYIHILFRIDKICIRTSTICHVVITENWIMKVTALTICFIHQTDASLVVQNCDSHTISRNEEGEVQYINIMVTTTRESVDPFIIRINGGDFQDLQDRISRSITIPSNITFHKTVIEKFVDTFKNFIQENPQFKTEQVC